MYWIRFLIRDKGFMMGGGFSAMKSPDASLVNDKGSLLPTSTKASSNSEDDNDPNQSQLSSGNNMMSSRHLPPVYVDIQEEIEQSLEEIKSESKY